MWEYRKEKKIIKTIGSIKRANLLFHSDNLTAMNYLLKNGFKGKVDLIYIDPPFWSSQKYFHRDNVKNTNKQQRFPLKMFCGWRKNQLIP